MAIVYGSEGRPRSGRRPATFLRAEEWPAAGQWLAESVGTPKARLLDRLAELGVATSSNRLASYFKGERLPEPATLEAICEAAALSYVEAVDRFGYYREIVRFFDDLVWLGAQWLEEDDARGGTLDPSGEQPSRLASLRETAVLYWKNEPITWGRTTPWSDKPGLDPFNVPEFTNRYIIGAWRELEHQNVSVEFPPIEAVPGGTFTLTAPANLERVDPSLQRESLIVPEHTEFVTVPKPIGIAILLATLAFPRRGDGYKERAPEYRYELGKAADHIARQARALRRESRAVGRPKNLHPLLQRACGSLDDRSIAFNYRRPVAAEYVLMWSDTICRRYTHFARLAAFDFWGEAGGHSWATAVVQQYNVFGRATPIREPRPSVFSMLPQMKLADLPEIDTLTRFN
jgi:hypothetical protein